MDKVVCFSLLFKNFPQFVVIHMITGFSLFNGAEGNAFLEFPCFLSDSVTIADLISGSSAFSKSSLYLWKFLVFILLKPGFKDFEYYLASIWNGYYSGVVWTFFGIAFLWYWNKKLTFSSPVDFTSELSQLRFYFFFIVDVHLTTPHHSPPSHHPPTLGFLHFVVNLVFWCWILLAFVVLNSLSFCLSVKLWISPLNMNETLAR